MAHLWLRVVLEDGAFLGPGKIDLLEAVGRQGSISAAARSMGMAYRHAWELVDAMNRSFREPVVETSSGGSSGGGASLTAWGEELLRRYREVEARALGATQKELDALEAHARGSR